MSKSKRSPLFIYVSLFAIIGSFVIGSPSDLNLRADAKGKEIVRYKKLKVWDADKKEQTSRMQVSDHRVILEVEEATAKYPLTIDPTFETAKLLASDGVAHEKFGISVSISGNTAIVGAHHSPAGRAFIFERDAGGVWTQQKILTAFDGVPGILFGISVSISEDTAIVGATSENEKGAGYIFERNMGGANNWGHVKKLTASDRAPGDSSQTSLFSLSMVSISGDTAILGAHRDDDIGGQDSGNFHTNSGSAYIFERNMDGPNNWGQVQKLTASDGEAGNEFGFSVSVSGDTAIVGVYLDDTVNGIDSGSAYIFQRNMGGPNNWGQVQKLTAPVGEGATGDWYGHSVSISGDTAIVGAYLNDDQGTDSGSAYILERNTGGTNNWGQVQKLTASDGLQYDHFGFSVSINEDRVVVGAVFDDNDIGDTGSAYTFVKDGYGDWNEEAKLLACDGAIQDRFGYSVSISGDTKIVGAWADDDYGESSGSAYIFSVPNSPPVADAGIDQLLEATGPGGALVTLDGSLSSDSDGDTLTYSWDGPFGTASGVMPDVTIPLGTHVVTLTVDDGNCHTSTDTVTVAVLYNFTGFFDPIDNVQINVAQAGRGIPIKFSLNGDKGVDILAPGYPLSFQIPCLDEEVDDEEIPTVTAGNSSLSYDPVTDQYNYVWKTSKEWKGMCRRLVVKLNDGSIHTADFQFK